MAETLTKELTGTHTDAVEELVEARQLVVHNDDINTFDWVILSLMEICGHTEEQAEQLSLIIHFKGKAVVKEDFYEKLSPLQLGLLDRGISATIE